MAWIRVCLGTGYPIPSLRRAFSHQLSIPWGMVHSEYGAVTYGPLANRSVLTVWEDLLEQTKIGRDQSLCLDHRWPRSTAWCLSSSSSSSPPSLITHHSWLMTHDSSSLMTHHHSWLIITHASWLMTYHHSCSAIHFLLRHLRHFF